MKSAVAAERNSQPLLRLEQVGKTYRMGEVTVPVLHHVNLTIGGGEILVVVGPSGSGKSTLLNLMGGIDAPSNGRVLFEGRDITSLTEAERTTYRRQNVGFVFQFYNLVPTLTARENVLVATEISDRPADPDDVLARVGLADRVSHFPAQLSGGEQQRVAIARAVAKNPSLLLCDEPTGSLDLATGRVVLDVLVKLKTDLGMTIVIITHNSAIAGIADRCVHLGSGTISEVTENRQPLPATEISW